MNALPPNYWATRLDARIHDPAEKAVVLMKLKGGHESGSVKWMRDAFKNTDLGNPDKEIVSRADHWASAADRVPWPKDFKKRYSDNIHFGKKPELTHPLSGDTYDLHSLNLDANEINEQQGKALSALLVFDEQGVLDARLTALALWRFGPELAPEDFGHLWRLLPADTRIPDHSIWQHLDLTAALAGAMVADSNRAPALLSLSIGPVQGFIAQARKTEDLWAGSHLLAQLAWEAARIIAETYGPEQLIFPALRGVPVVDHWIAEQLSQTLARLPYLTDVLNNTKHKQRVAALPNRLLAIVPSDQAASIALTIKEALHEWLNALGNETIATLFDDADITDPKEIAHIRQQMKRHLDTLLEFHWVAVPWTLAGKDNGLDIDSLTQALVPFYPEDDTAPGMLASPLLKALNKHAGHEAETQHFWKPNPGTAYAALYDIADRSLAATKAAHRSDQTDEQGFRCSLCGEREILCAKPEHRFVPRGKRNRDNDIWQRRRDSASKSNRQEALCGVCAIKREWAGIWNRRINGDINAGSAGFIVSTHVMAATPRLANLNNAPPETSDEHVHGRPVALPLALYELCRKNNSKDTIFHDIAASEDPNHEDHDSDIDSGLYYGIMLFDGDRMGAWLSGDTSQHINLIDAWNTGIAQDARKIAKEEKTGTLSALLNSPRVLSPSLHATLSATLNDFAIGVVPELINHRHMGQLIYAGGDDVLAMLPHNQLLPAALAVRQHWSGLSDKAPTRDDRTTPSRGFVISHRRNQLFRAMGERATGSAGLVLVPAKMPLQRALQQVRAAEKTAKTAGRDRFSISVVKRAGGTLQWTGEWPVPRTVSQQGANKTIAKTPRNDMYVLTDFIRLLDINKVSARFGFQMQAWARQLEGSNGAWQSSDKSADEQFTDMISKSLAWQLNRQGLSYDKQQGISARVSASVSAHKQPLESLRHFLGIAEFLARKEQKAREGIDESSKPQEQPA